MNMRETGGSGCWTLGMGEKILQSTSIDGKYGLLLVGSELV